MTRTKDIEITHEKKKLVLRFHREEGDSYVSVVKPAGINSYGEGETDQEALQDLISVLEETITYPAWDSGFGITLETRLIERTLAEFENDLRTLDLRKHDEVT